jgi:hypothetical protein
MSPAIIEQVLDIAERDGRKAALAFYADAQADAADAAREGRLDALRALEDDPTGQDDEDVATRYGCGADDTFDKSGARRLGRFNDAGEARW